MAFAHEIRLCGLSSQYPDLVSKLSQGFPLSLSSFSFPFSETPPNHFSCIGYDSVIDDYVKEEVSLGRMDGPFSRSELDIIFGDTFVSTPLIIVSKKGPLGQPDKIRICRNSSKSYGCGVSVNDFIDPDDFSTLWTTATQVADVVSFTFLWRFVPFWNRMFSLCLCPL